jgi:hypothetical protein
MSFKPLSISFLVYEKGLMLILLPVQGTFASQLCVIQEACIVGEKGSTLRWGASAFLVSGINLIMY